ncbi:hypothetical protein V1318_02430 [Lysobacter sp. CCNWLW3]|uniref:hypothetical protein n=1 Tax=unclassified Lysobacter TaxID=2635362 RepID=UPI002FD71EDF
MLAIRRSALALSLAATSLPVGASDFTVIGVLFYLIPGLLVVCALLGLSFRLPVAWTWKAVTASIFVPALAYLGWITLSLFPRHTGLGLGCLVLVLLAAFLLVKLLARRPDPADRR